VAVAGARVCRLTNSADFERVLAQPAKASNRHFALHGLELPGAPRGRPARVGQDHLSTGKAEIADDSVDNVPESHPVETPSPCVWLGLVVPKRFAKRSVLRSLVKRQIRSGVSRHLHHFPSGIWVVRLRATFDKPRFISAASDRLRSLVRSEVDELLKAVPNLPRGLRLRATGA
jgi:ribonuclease P protein component